jgi:uncharacterized membrane protein YoaK (UPF0700 family)
LWFALLLTLTNGFMDAHTYYVRGGVFANVQTGNVIFFAIELSARKVTAAMAHVWPILALADSSERRNTEVIRRLRWELCGRLDVA